jgi:hypothetical protein
VLADEEIAKCVINQPREEQRVTEKIWTNLNKCQLANDKLMHLFAFRKEQWEKWSN